MPERTSRTRPTHAKTVDFHGQAITSLGAFEWRSGAARQDPCLPSFRACAMSCVWFKI